MSINSTWPSIESHMRAAGVEELAIESFHRHYEMLSAGEESFIREREIESVDQTADLEQLDSQAEQAGRKALSQTVMLKLNGGLGTSMGLSGPKSLLPLREGMTFLDIMLAQTDSLHVPLLLMNSFATDEATRASLRKQRPRNDSRVTTFLQHAVPKISAADLTPVAWEPQPELAWCPPGHGDLYAALVTSGSLARLLAENYRWMFVSNADNLGATLDPRVLGHLVQGGHSFLMEVADRTESDRKGGHLAKRPDGTLLLREKAQCHDDDQRSFQDIDKYRYFNTNNLWIDLQALAGQLDLHEQILPLSLIVNRKTVDPVDATSPTVYQLETAMGSAISLLPHSTALRVPRSRFAPVKTTGDLLAIRSDAYRVDRNFAVQLIEERDHVPPTVRLDDRYYKTIADLNRHISRCPSLRACQSLAIEGPFELNQTIAFVDNVTLRNRSPETKVLEAGEYTGDHEF